MKKIFLLFAFIVLFIESIPEASALSFETTQIDTLAYKKKVFEKHSKTCVRKDYMCAVFKVQYPVFENLVLNKNIQQELLNIFQNNSDPQTNKIKNLDEAANSFLDDYDQILKEIQAEGNRKLSDIETIPWNTEASVNVEKQSEKYLIINITTDWFTGGAHPVSMNYNYMYDTKTFKRISLEDIFKKGYEPSLLTIAESVFRKQENLKASDKLDDENGFFFEDGKFKLNNNFKLTKTSIQFLYNVYEIKPYAAGTTTLDIPLNKIKILLK